MTVQDYSSNTWNWNKNVWFGFWMDSDPSRILQMDGFHMDSDPPKNHSNCHMKIHRLASFRGAVGDILSLFRTAIGQKSQVFIRHVYPIFNSREIMGIYMDLFSGFTGWETLILLIGSVWGRWIRVHVQASCAQFHVNNRRKLSIINKYNRSCRKTSSYTPSMDYKLSMD